MTFCSKVSRIAGSPNSSITPVMAANSSGESTPRGTNSVTMTTSAPNRVGATAILRQAANSGSASRELSASNGFTVFPYAQSAGNSGGTGYAPASILL